MKRIFLLLGILCIFISCSTFSNKKMVINIENANEEIIVKNESGKNVYGLYCKIDGKINGNLEIEFSNGENLLKKVVPENDTIDFVYNGDWYANEFIVKITSNGKTSGYINITYSFNKLY